MENTINQQNKTGGLPDIRKIFWLVISNWYLFVISFPICLGTVYLMHRYTLNVYRGSVTIMMKSDEQRGITGAGIIDGFGLSPESKSIENQTIILRSKKLVKRSIDNLDFAVDIHSDGFLKDYNLYHSSPFNIEFDSTHVQILNTPILIKPQANNKVKVIVNTENASLHIFKNEVNKGGSGLIEFEKEISWGEEINTPFCKFKLIANNSQFNQDNNFYFYFRSHNWLASQYRYKVGVKPHREGSSIIYITSTGTSRAKILAFLRELSKVYLEQSLERKNEIAEQTISFIESQLKQISDSLKDAQGQMMEFRRAHTFSAPTEISKRLANNFFDYESQIGIIEIKQNYYEKLRTMLINNPLSDDYLLPAFSLDANSFITKMVTDLLTLHNERTVLLDQSNENNPILHEIDQKIEVGKANILVALEKIIQNIDIEKDKLRNQMNEAAAKMNTLPDNERQYLDIEREYKLNDAIYTFLLQKHSETQIAKASNTPDNEILDEAVITGLISPNKSKNNQQAFILALIIPIAIIVLKEYLNNKIRNKDDILSIVPDATIIGYIPENRGSAHNIIQTEPLSSISESFRALRTKLKFMVANNDKLVITITSTNTSEGKTFCALNLASAFAISDKKTALVGFDLRKPRLTQLFSHHNQPGLSNYLIGQSSFEEIQFSGGIDNLIVIPSGAIPPNPSELISHGNTAKLFNQLKEEFDVIIVDSPPIGVVADARLLMDYSNCCLYVTRANKTNKEHFRHTILNLKEEKIPSFGLILNDINTSGGQYGYYSEKYYIDQKKS